MDDHALRVYDSILGLLSGAENPTPLVRLNRVTPYRQTAVYAKLEWYNPFGAVKDRVAANLLEDGEKRHTVSERQKLVEPTSGNTGMALAMLANARGYSLTTPMSSEVPARKTHDAPPVRRRRDGTAGYSLPGARCAGGSDRPGGGDRRPPRLPHAEPVRQRGEPGGALQDDRSGNLAADRGNGDPFRRRVGHLRDDHRDRAFPERAACRRGGARRLSAGRDTISRECGACGNCSRRSSSSPTSTTEWWRCRTRRPSISACG